MEGKMGMEGKKGMEGKMIINEKFYCFVMGCIKEIKQVYIMESILRVRETFSSTLRMMPQYRMIVY